MRAKKWQKWNQQRQLAANERETGLECANERAMHLRKNKNKNCFMSNRNVGEKSLGLSWVWVWVWVWVSVSVFSLVCSGFTTVGFRWWQAGVIPTANEHRTPWWCSRWRCCVCLNLPRTYIHRSIYIYAHTNTYKRICTYIFVCVLTMRARPGRPDHKPPENHPVAQPPDIVQPTSFVVLSFSPST